MFRQIALFVIALIAMLIVDALSGENICAAAHSEHHAFEAALEAPYFPSPAQAASASGAIMLHFSQPEDLPRPVRWRLDLLDPAGVSLRHWRGRTLLRDGAASVAVAWSSRQRAADLAPAPRAPRASGNYRLRLRAESGPARGRDAVLQSWDIAPAAPAAATAPGLQAAAPLPYTVYYGNLHSQTSHSDGGGALAHCHGAQPPQGAPFGPHDAYTYAHAHGLAFLMASEHNHLYDGSDGTNANADPARARALYHSGLAAAAAYTAAHPGFVAIYGMEWGVINHGGHLNILNSPELLGWEHNRQGALLADTLTPRSDYAALYALMRRRGWIGQFNHPSGDQFRVGGQALGYTADGDAAMALCEVMNSSAFSANTTETEPRRSEFEAACQHLLEAGYHLAFTSNQDNHCANWGMSYTNRTAVLIPAGHPLTPASLLDALRARPVFATMDRQARLVLSANGHLMGERFSNRGPLTLSVQHASASGRTVAALAIIAGSPGRKGSAAALPGAAASTTITPARGPHFYYARVTQDDGTLLWSAPVWVDQQ
jgi:hypothetical protein